MLITHLDRARLLEMLPRGGTVAEVGVYKGGFSTAIRDHAQPDTLHLIDTWAMDQDDEYVRSYGTKPDSLHRAFDLIQRLFAEEIAGEKVVVHRDYSMRAATTFPDHTFDWVYIDAMHDYDNVLADLLSYKDKVKPDGFILGHDFINVSAGRRANFGVVPAVRDFAASEGFELVVVTNEAAPSYLLARKDNQTTLPALREALLQCEEPLPVEVGPALVDRYESVPLVYADDSSGALMRFGEESGGAKRPVADNQMIPARQPEGTRMAASLERLGRRFETDKIKHNYLPEFERFLEPLRHEPLDLLEIGVYKGSSIQMWHEYFPRANIVGLDLKNLAPGLDEKLPRYTFFQGSQADPKMLQKLLEQHAFRIMIDDGSHLWGHQIFTFQTLFPWIEPGGVYICEDIHTSFGKQAEVYNGGATESAAHYFLRLSEAISAGRNWGQPESQDPSMFHIVNRIQSVTMIRHCAIVVAR